MLSDQALLSIKRIMVIFSWSVLYLDLLQVGFGLFDLILDQVNARFEFLYLAVALIQIFFFGRVGSAGLRTSNGVYI